MASLVLRIGLSASSLAAIVAIAPGAHAQQATDASVASDATAREQVLRAMPLRSPSPPPVPADAPAPIDAASEIGRFVDNGPTCALGCLLGASISGGLGALAGVTVGAWGVGRMIDGDGAWGWSLVGGLAGEVGGARSRRSS